MVGTSGAQLPEGIGPAARRLAQELRALKEALGLTLTQLGAQTHYSRASWKRWLNGKRLIPFNLIVGTTARAVLDKVLFGLTQERIPYYWIDRKVREGVDAPRVLPSREMALRVAASLKGAITYVDAAPSVVLATLRVLSIDGFSPSAPDYPLTIAHSRE